MEFNPLNNNIAFSSTTTIILTIIFTLMGFKEASIIALAIGILWTATLMVVNSMRRKNRISREKEFMKYKEHFLFYHLSIIKK